MTALPTRVLARVESLPEALRPRHEYVAATQAYVRAVDAFHALPADHDEAVGLAALDRLGRARLRLEIERARHAETRCEAPVDGARCNRCYPCETDEAYFQAESRGERSPNHPPDVIWAAAMRALGRI